MCVCVLVCDGIGAMDEFAYLCLGIYQLTHTHLQTREANDREKKKKHTKYYHMQIKRPMALTPPCVLDAPCVCVCVCACAPPTKTLLPINCVLHCIVTYAEEVRTYETTARSHCTLAEFVDFFAFFFGRWLLALAHLCRAPNGYTRKINKTNNQNRRSTISQYVHMPSVWSKYNTRLFLCTYACQLPRYRCCWLWLSFFAYICCCLSTTTYDAHICFSWSICNADHHRQSMYRAHTGKLYVFIAFSSSIHRCVPSL